MYIELFQQTNCCAIEYAQRGRAQSFDGGEQGEAVIGESHPEAENRDMESEIGFAGRENIGLPFADTSSIGGTLFGFYDVRPHARQSMPFSNTWRKGRE